LRTWLRWWFHRCFRKVNSRAGSGYFALDGGADSRVGE
jgi:hypothetical protein